MNPVYALVARKYAAAFLSVAGDSFGPEDLKHTVIIKRLLRENRALLFFLNMPFFKQELIDQVLDRLLASCRTRDLLYRLMLMVIERRRALMIPDILHHIADIYCLKRNTMIFSIKSSHPLSDASIGTVCQFLAEKTGSQIMHDYSVDQKLIAGISMMSSTFLWEHSVLGQLKSLLRSIND